MPFFLVTKTFTYSETITLEAATKEEAIAAAIHSDDCDRIHDDTLDDCTAKEVPQPKEAP